MSKIPEFLYHPCVFVIEDIYQIMFNTDIECMAHITVGDKEYSDSVIGLRRSDTKIHRINVPREELDRERSYTVHIQHVEERYSYFPKLGETNSKTYKFCPVDFEKDVHIYHLADCHQMVELPSKAASFFGDELDLLILNGDISECESENGFLYIYRIASNIVCGEKPVIYVRGNHDTRGPLAPNFINYIPHTKNTTYYTFKLGKLWGMALDCGEDKPDDHPAYNGVVDFHKFRLEETAFIEKVLREKQFENKDVDYKIIICHVPFTEKHNPPFNIEEDLYEKWVEYINQINPLFLLCGHVHKTYITNPDDDGDKTYLGQKFPVVTGSYSTNAEDDFLGAAITLSKDKANIKFTNQNKEVVEEINM